MTSAGSAPPPYADDGDGGADSAANVRGQIDAAARMSVPAAAMRVHAAGHPLALLNMGAPHELSNDGVVALVTCSMVGSSLTSLPYFYGQAGLLAGLGWTAAAYAGSLVSLRLLQDATRQTGTRSYPMLGLFAHGTLGARAVDAAVVVFQFGTAVGASAVSAPHTRCLRVRTLV